MEPTETTEPGIPGNQNEIILTEDAQYYLHQAAKWAKFLGIMGFIGAGFMALAGIFFGTIMSVMSQFQRTPLPMAFGGVMGFFYIIIAAVAFFIALKLYQFGNDAKNGVEFRNTDQITKAIENLKTFLKIKGIIIICVLALYALVIVGVIIGGIAGASMMHK